MLLKIKLRCPIFISCKLILRRKYVIYLQQNFICPALPLKHLCICSSRPRVYVWTIMDSGVLKRSLKRTKWQSQSLHSCAFCPLHHIHTVFDLISYKQHLISQFYSLHGQQLSYYIVFFTDLNIISLKSYRIGLNVCVNIKIKCILDKQKNKSKNKGKTKEEKNYHQFKSQEIKKADIHT